MLEALSIKNTIIMHKCTALFFKVTVSSSISTKCGVSVRACISSHTAATLGGKFSFTTSRLDCSLLNRWPQFIIRSKYWHLKIAKSKHLLFYCKEWVTNTVEECIKGRWKPNRQPIPEEVDFSQLKKKGIILE